MIAITTTSLNRIPEVELSYRYPISPNNLPCITNTQQAYNALLDSWNLNHIELFE